MNRRGFLKDILLVSVAPAIVPFSSLMKPKSLVIAPASILTLSEEALEKAMIEMMQATDERGLKIALFPNEVYVPTSYYIQAAALAKKFWKVPIGKGEGFNSLLEPVLEVKILPNLKDGKWFVAARHKDKVYRMSEEPIARINGDFNKAPILIEGEE